MGKFFKTININADYALAFFLTMIIPPIFWNRLLYVVDNDKGLIQLFVGTLNYVFVPVETMTIVILRQHRTKASAAFCAMLP